MPLKWNPPIELSELEQKVLKSCKNRKIFGFLRMYRHKILTEAFQEELAKMYKPRRAGKDIIPPALLALVILLQAALGVSDDDAVSLAVNDRRWQLVLGTLGQEDQPFCKGDLYHFRVRLIAQDLDRNLLERTVALARETGGFGHAALRAAFDASPLVGAGRVEDTFNLIGHAARLLLTSAAEKLGLSFQETANQAGIPLLTGSSLKAMLDINWDDPTQKKKALELLLTQVQLLHDFLKKELGKELEAPPLKGHLQTLQQILEQDIEPDPEGGGKRIRPIVAKDRRCSISDPDMRHGRKSKVKKFNGFKRHLAVDLDAMLIVAVAITKGNEPEGKASKELFEGIEKQKGIVAELEIDRGYLTATEVESRREKGMQVHCKAFPLRNKEGLFTKDEFQLNVAKEMVTCPASVSIAMQLGKTVKFPQKSCQKCQLREQCTTSKTGRSLSIHQQEPFYIELRKKQKTPEGRATLRKRTPVEHLLASVSQSQGHRARYRGERKNLFDLRRHAAISNLYRIDRILSKVQAPIAI